MTYDAFVAFCLHNDYAFTLDWGGADCSIEVRGMGRGELWFIKKTTLKHAFQSIVEDILETSKTQGLKIEMMAFPAAML